MSEEFALDFSPEELHEFLAADLMEVPFDPEFKEELRVKLSEFVKRRYGKSSPANLPKPKGKS